MCRLEPRLECEEDGTYPFTEVDPANTCCNVTSCSKAPTGGARGGRALAWSGRLGPQACLRGVGAGQAGVEGAQAQGLPCLGSVCKLTGVSPLPAECNASLCREKPPLCSLGFQVKSEIVPGRCCPLYSCGRWAGPGGSEA